MMNWDVMSDDDFEDPVLFRDALNYALRDGADEGFFDWRVSWAALFEKAESPIEARILDHMMLCGMAWRLRPVRSRSIDHVRRAADFLPHHECAVVSKPSHSIAMAPSATEMPCVMQHLFEAACPFCVFLGTGS